MLGAGCWWRIHVLHSKIFVKVTKLTIFICMSRFRGVNEYKQSLRAKGPKSISQLATELQEQKQRRL